MSVVIIGGGWSGLAAAVELARHQVPVTVLESSRQLGGRARAVRFGSHHVDNGQHVLLGAYTGILDMLAQLGIEEQRVLRREPLHLRLLDSHRHLSLRTPRAPAPLHLAWAVLKARGLKTTQRHQALRFGLRLRRSNFAVDPDMPLTQFLHDCHQDPDLVRRLWQPLCLAALNTPTEQASSAIFVRVLRDAFFDTRAASDLLLPITDLSSCFPEPARDFVEQHGGSVRLATRAIGLQFKAGRVRGVQLQHSTVIAEHVIIATPVHACRALLKPHAALASLGTQLSHLHHSPICTLYLQYPRSVKLPQAMLGLLGGTAQWIFDRGKLTGDHGLMAVVVSGGGEHMEDDVDTLTARLTAEVAAHFPRWPAPLKTKLIRERRATFLSAVGVDLYRPKQETPVENLWLAGDYTATGYPATLEGAVRSGIKCARRIINS